MRKSVIALVQIALVMSVAVAAMVAPLPAQAHWRHPHRAWHRVWGPSYYPAYGFFRADPYRPVCIWRREWDAYWHRDCF